MAKQDRAIRTRNQILESMASLFNEVGYDAATIAALVERTGLTRGALYFHFASKEDIARAVLDEAVTREGLREQAFKVQEWVDLGLLLAYRVPREPILHAAIRLSVDPKARRLFGTRWPDWVAVGEGFLTEAKQRGELLPHADPAVVSRTVVGSWTGVQLVSEAMSEDLDLAEEISVLYQLVLPNVVTPTVLARIDSSPYRAERLLKEQSRTSAVE
ncbi:TetR family transcriptional regulator [Streptomyces spongiicola]|uniref:TetR family transcriptional regulator n=1 Tax=Streptomyces spongiicola TaxID=1690221 RepID=A0ABM6V489_9ACTN|nr:TetR family transcriptional regulator [Streptomyces spongiicola]